MNLVKCTMYKMTKENGYWYTDYLYPRTMKFELSSIKSIRDGVVQFYNRGRYEIDSSDLDRVVKMWREYAGLN